MHRQGIRSAELSAGTIVLGYVLTAVLWFALSDRVLGAIVSDPGTLVTIFTLKSWAFVAATGAILARLGTGVGSGRCETHLVCAVRQFVSAEVSGEWR